MSDTDIEVYYQQDETGEWYTLIIEDRAYQMSGSINNVPNGREFHQFIGNVDNGKIVRSQLGEEISLEDCPENVQDAIEQRNELL